MRKALAGAVVLLSLLTSFALFALPAGAVEQTVTARDFLFDPATKNVNVNDTIRFTNASTTTTHNVTFETPSTTNLGNMAPGGSVLSPAFPNAGTFTYFCNIHPSQMRGTVIVGSGTTTTGTRTITVNPTSVAPGATFTVSGTGFPANTTLDLLVNNVKLDSTLTDSSGNFTKQLTMPPQASPPGSYAVLARSANDANVTATTNIQLTAPVGTTVTTLTPGSVTATTLATGTTLPTALPPAAVPPSASGTTYTGTARTGRNEHLMMVVAAVALALGTLLVMVTPKPGRHAKKAFNIF